MGFTKKLFEPLFAHPLDTIYELFINSLVASTGPIVVIFFQQILRNVENGLPYTENYPILGYIALTIFVPGVMRLFTSRHETRLYISANKYLFRKYLERFIYLDNEQVQRYGTGKLIAIIQDGLSAWTDQLWRMYVHAFPQMVAYLISLSLIVYIHIGFLIPAILFTIFEIVFIYVVNKKTHKYRTEKRKWHEGLSRQVTKIIMEKFTILKNGRIESEQKIIDQTWDKIYLAGSPQ